MTERSLEELMSEADSLGIPYPMNIGAKTLQNKIKAYHAVEEAEVVAVETETQVVEATTTYLNTSKKNIFTTQGRCMPGKSIELDIHEAGNYEGLEKV